MKTKAWSRFTLKAINETERVIAGIASTPSTDRAGDIVEPLGATWSLPLPFLNGHDHNSPLGWVQSAKSTAAGIAITAKLAAAGIDPGIDRAWNLIKNGLVRGLSIGFIPKTFHQLDAGGTQFDTYEIIEISSVVVPANADASITTIKTLSENPMDDDLITPTDAPAADLPETDAPAPVVKASPPASRRPVPSAAPAVHTVQRSYSLGRLVRRLSGEDVDAGLEFEFSQELGQRHLATNPEARRKGFSVPLSAIFVNKATAGTAAGSAAKLTTEDLRRDMLLDVGAAIRNELLAGRIGVNTITTNERVLRVPTVTTKLAAEVVALDAALSDAGAPVIGDVAIQPVTMGCLASVLRSAMYAIGADQVVAAQIRNSLVELADKIIIGPTGGAPTPAGLLDTAGSTAATVTALATYADAVAIKGQLQAYLQDQMKGVWVLRPEFVDALGAVPRAAGFLVPTLDPTGTLVQMPVVPSFALPEKVADTSHHALFGDFSAAYFAIFGDSIDLQINPYGATDWARGSVSMRAIMDFGFLAQDPLRVLRFTTAD